MNMLDDAHVPHQGVSLEERADPLELLVLVDLHGQVARELLDAARRSVRGGAA